MVMFSRKAEIVSRLDEVLYLIFSERVVAGRCVTSRIRLASSDLGVIWPRLKEVSLMTFSSPQTINVS